MKKLAFLLLMLSLGSLCEPACSQTVKVGVMLPLHDDNGDGRRMVEYYRGVLMGCDSLRKTGLNIDLHAWNMAEGADVAAILKDPAAAKCDVIIGPLYSRQMALLSDFVNKHDIKLFIPFSIYAPQLSSNKHIYQVYQSPELQNAAFISRFMEQFAGYHPVFIDCNDSTSKKGPFTAALRSWLDSKGVAYNLTSLKSSESSFQKAFSRQEPNVVILNTGRAPELNVAFAKINGMVTTYPDVKVSMFGYTEWLMYTRQQLDNFYRFNTYIPSTFFYNPLYSLTARIEQKYRWNFHQDMQKALPRFAITGFDHAMFLLKGLARQRKNFTGMAGTVDYTPAQTPLRFEREGSGGWQNHSVMFVHYMPEQRVETIKF
jgi:hypothetical protein